MDPSEGRMLPSDVRTAGRSPATRRYRGLQKRRPSGVQAGGDSLPGLAALVDPESSFCRRRRCQELGEGPNRRRWPPSEGPMIRALDPAARFGVSGKRVSEWHARRALALTAPVLLRGAIVSGVLP